MNKTPKPYKIKTISANLTDILNNEIYPAKLEIKNGKIKKITKTNESYDTFLIPGLIDAHIHIESSMLTPCEFARTAVRNGMVSVVADPHEIANVVGTKGIDFMIENGKKTPFKFYFSAPSCVPATQFETSGAKIDSKEIERLMKRKEIKCLGEVMDFVGVIEGKNEVLAKIEAAKANNKPSDGHAPGVLGKDLEKYINSGISTDHEANTKQEALEKIKLGMKILIREGSAAKDFEALCELIQEYPDFCMFSSDDRHPNDLVRGHIDLLVKRALAKGYDHMKVLKCACLNPVKHYGLDVGLLQEGDCADFIQINNFEDFSVIKTVIDGLVVSENGWSLIPKIKTKSINNFKAQSITKEDISCKYTGKKINVIEATDGLLTTKRLYIEPKIENGFVVSDTEKDILKIVVLNRYENSKPAVGFIKGFGFQKGAIASSVAHDSHNIIAVGTNDEDITKAINLIIENKGGLCVVNEQKELILPLPIAGLISDKSAFDTAEEYGKIEAESKTMGTKLSDPFMTLSFMTLLVIGDLKLSDKGLFDSKNFKLIDLDEEI